MLTRLGQECQDLLSPCDEACERRLDLGLYSHPKEFWEIGVRTHVNSKGNITSTGKILPRGVSALRRCIKDSKPDTPPTSYSGLRGMNNPDLHHCEEIRGRYHGGRRSSSDDSFHSPAVIPPSALDKPSIMKRYYRRRTTR